MAEVTARELFAPLGPTYDRYARLLSFGQDPRWRRFLVSRIPSTATHVVDVATGTAAVAIELAQAVPARTVVGVDQSPEMLSAGRARVAHAGLTDRVELREGRAESLPFADGEFDALTFTYLLRYVDDPVATMRELARVVRPGGVVAMQEFGLPRGPWRPLWELYVRVGLPLAGAVVSPGWRDVGVFLGPSIRGF
ncbi:MAG TPA: class I SAM-dependent methyltransferase, partial [Polyangiaceae bacterium]